MTRWTRLDVTFTRHPKVIAAGHQAALLYVSSLGYAGELLTDGFIPVAVVPQLGRFRGVMQLVERLVDSGLWEPVAGGYMIHDYLVYNQSREDILKERESARSRMKRARSPEVRPNSAGTSPTTGRDTTGRENLPVLSSTGDGESPSVRPNGAGHAPAPDGAAPDPDDADQPSWKTDAETLERVEATRRAFTALGQDFPPIRSYGERRALESLLKVWPPEQLADCWSDIRSGRYGDDFDRRELSWGRLNARQRLTNWREWKEGRSGLVVVPRRRDGFDARAY